MGKLNNNDVDIRVTIDGEEHKLVKHNSVLHQCDRCSLIKYCGRLCSDEMLCELLYGAAIVGSFEKVNSADADAKIVVLDGEAYDMVDCKAACRKCPVRKHCDKMFDDSMCTSPLCFALRDAFTPDNFNLSLRKREEG